eukprot:6287568-Alexandrium_andersonii.AAC.1
MSKRRSTAARNVICAGSGSGILPSKAGRGPNDPRVSPLADLLGALVLHVAPDVAVGVVLTAERLQRA